MSMISYRACDMCDKPMQGSMGYAQIKLLGKRTNGSSASISLNPDFWKRKDTHDFDVCSICWGRIGVLNVQGGSNPAMQRPSNTKSYEDLL